MKLFGGSHFRKSLKDYVVGRIGQGLLAVVFTFVTIKFMSPRDYGTYIVLIGLCDFMRPLTSLGVLPTIQQFLPEMALHASIEQFKKFTNTMRLIRWSLLITLILVLFCVWDSLVSFIGVDETSPNTVFLVLLVIFGILSLEYSEAMLESLLDQKSAQIARIVHMFLRISGILVIVCFFKISVDMVLSSECVAAIVAIVLSEIRLSKSLKLIRPDGSKVFSNAEILSFAKHLSLNQIMNTFATPGVLRLFVARHLGIEVAGQFGFMQTLLQQINKLMPSLLFSNLVRPMLIAARARNQIDKVSNSFGFLFKVNVWLVWPLFPILLLVGDELMDVISSGKLVGMGDEMAWMILGLSSMTQMQVAAIVLQTYKMSVQLAWAGLLSILAPIFVYFSSQSSLMYVCISLFIATSIRYIVTMIVIQRSNARVRLDGSGSIRYLLGLIIAFSVVKSFEFSSIYVSLSLFVIVHLVLQPLVKPIAEFEAEVFREALKRNIPFLKILVNR